MGDLLRIVTLPRDGRRPVVERDIYDGTSFALQRDTLAVVPGQRTPRTSPHKGRNAGSKTVGETRENGTFGATWIVSGATSDAALANAEALLGELEEATAPDRYIEWRPNGAARSVYYEIRGPGTWTPRYRWVQFVQNKQVEVEATSPVAPLARGPSMDIWDDFAVDSLADYSLDAGAGQVAVAGGVLTATSNLTAEKRAAHTDRGYDYGDAQATIKTTLGTTVTSYKAGAVLKRTASDTYLEVYLDDNGTNSRLRIDTVIAGTRANEVSVNLGARMSASTAVWVRGRVEGDVVYAEHFTSAPTPLSTPTTTTSHTLTAGDLTAFGPGAAGKAGWSWVPQQAAATLDDLVVEPYTYRNRTWPNRVSLAGAIPGSAPALGELVLTQPGTTNPVFGLLGWNPTPASATEYPFGVFEAEDATNIIGTGDWGIIGEGAGTPMRGANKVRVNAAGAGNGSLTIPINPARLLADEFGDDVSVEVWARVEMASTIVSPRAIASAYSGAGATYGTERFTDEYGTAGKSLAVPSSGSPTPAYFVRLGTIPLYTRYDRTWLLKVNLTYATGSTGRIGLDYVLLVPARRRACSPTGRADDANYPDLFPGAGAATTKGIRADLSGWVAPAGQIPYPDHGLGGSRLEPDPGLVDLVLKLSSQVPDNPTAPTTAEALAISATAHLSVIPRYFLARG